MGREFIADISFGFGDLLENGAEEICISVRTNNPDAHRLYERAGFRDKETVYAYKKST